jgi:HK97 gp10 family phage protein
MALMTLGQLMAEFVEEIAAVEVKIKVAREAAVNVGIADAKTRVPVLTGTLRDSIGPDEDGYGAGAPYAPFVEFGTSDTAPQPFIGPSSDTAETVFVTGIAATIGP